MADWLVSQAAFEAALGEARFFTGLRHGSMSVEFYRPAGKDEQQPHRQDELYIVYSGSGTFSKGREIRRFQAGDVIFVEAGAEHRFETFSDDFATWVVFWGPEGGEEDKN